MLLAELFVERLDLGHGFATGTAPGGPEVDQHHFAPIPVPVEVGAERRDADEFEWLADQVRASARGALGQFLAVASQFLALAGGKQIAEPRELLLPLVIVTQAVDRMHGFRSDPQMAFDQFLVGKSRMNLVQQRRDLIERQFVDVDHLALQLQEPHFLGDLGTRIVLQPLDEFRQFRVGLLVAKGSRVMQNFEFGQGGNGLEFV